MGLLTKNEMAKRKLRLGYYRGVSQKQDFKRSAKSEPPLAQMPPIETMVKEEQMVKSSPRVMDMSRVSPNTRGVIDKLLQGNGVRSFGGGVRNHGSGFGGGSISQEQVFSQSARV